jgi:PAS domain S-box-containing protein
MSLPFPLRANLPGAPSAEADGPGALQFLRGEVAALLLENEHLRRSLATELSKATPPAVSAASEPAETTHEAAGLPVQFKWADAGARPDNSLATLASLLTAVSTAFPIGIFSTDSAGLLTQVDANLQQMFGLELSSFANFGWLAAVHPDDRQRVKESWFEYAMQTVSHSTELRLLRNDGEIRHVQMRNAPRLDSAGEFQGQFGFVQDITELRALEAEAILKEELNRQIIASSPDCTKVLDLQGRVLQMTAQGCRLVELDNFQDAYLADWLTWWPHEGTLLARASVEGAARGMTTRFIGFCPTFKGTDKWWDTVINPICNAAGEPVMLLAVSRDISELHRQQDEIKALNESLEARVELRTQELAQANQRISQALAEAQALYNQAPCGYHSVNGDGLFVRINQTELDWLGYQREEVVGRLHFRDLAQPDQVDSLKQRLAQLKLGQTLDPAEVCLRRRDGTTLNALLTSTAVLDAHGNFLHTNNTLVDISARHTAEQALSAQRAFLQTITDSVPVQLAFYDRNLICRFANASYARWLNAQPANLIGLHLNQVARPENFADARFHLTAALAGEAQRFEGQRTFPDGTSFYASIEYTPYRVEGAVQGIVIQMVDISQRKAAEDRVREVNQQLHISLERAQNLYNHAPCGYHSVDRNGYYVSINDTELAWLGYSREEVVGRLTHQDLMVPKNAGMLEERLQRLMSHGLVEPVEYEMRQRDGSVFPVLVSSTAVRDANGEYLHSNTTVVDISERVVAEKALQSNERFIHAIADNVPGLIAYVDTGLRFRFANANFLPIYGLDPSAILGKPLRECFERDIWDEVSPRLQAALAGETQRFEAWRQTVQGQQIFISATYLPDLHEGEVKGIFIQVIEITERKRVEERVSELNNELERRIRERSIELLESEQRFRLMVDNMRDYSAFFLDANGVITDWTDSAQRMDGFTPTEMLGRHYRRLFERSDGKNAAEQAEKMLLLASSRGQHEVNGWHERKDGSHYWAHSLLIALRDDDGELRGFAKISRDMSDAKRLDDLMRNINDELEERVTERTAQLLAANKDLESFSYSVSHDLRSPLRHVASFVSLLQEHLGDQCDEVSTRYLGTIGTSARHMSQLIDGLLAFSHLGRAAVNIAPVDSALLVDTVVAQLAHDTEGRSIDWVVAPDLPVVQGDALLLREVWANLLGNAYKYTRPRERTRIEVGWGVDPAKGHTFFVRDNGVGFDTKYAAKLFGVFQRLHRATEFEGTGIGLALTRRIIERHGGSIWAESQLGEGSVFSFSLPFENLHATGSLHQ